MITLQGSVCAEGELEEAWGADARKAQKVTESCNTKALPSQEMKWQVFNVYSWVFFFLGERKKGSSRLHKYPNKQLSGIFVIFMESSVS